MSGKKKRPAAAPASPPKRGGRKVVTRMETQDSKRVRNRALRILYGERPISEVAVGIFAVPSESEGAVRYTANLHRATCECADWRKRKRECKHIAAARMWHAHITGDLVPSAGDGYRNPPYYERLCHVRRPCIRETLRCVGRWVGRG